MTSKEQIQAFLDLVESIMDLIKAKGAMGLPSGELYAVLMGSLTLDQYNKLIAMLVKANRITQSNYLLIAI